MILPDRRTVGVFLASDLCGARARAQVVLTGGELLFGDHHGREHGIPAPRRSP